MINNGVTAALLVTAGLLVSWANYRSGCQCGGAVILTQLGLHASQSKPFLQLKSCSSFQANSNVEASTSPEGHKGVTEGLCIHKRF